ncbi:MAG: four helix bundle protein [Anaerolineae bacterium]|nr:four helix bundle protein [Anaerolineae bacterium]
MAGVERFEDLIAWQKARSLTSAIYRLTRKEDFARDFGLAGQIQRAGVSVMSNIAEGFDRENPKEFHHFLMIAKASCAELRSQLYVAQDIGYLNQQEFEEILNQAQEVARIINGLRLYIAKQRGLKD